MSARMGLNVAYTLLASACYTAEDRERLEVYLSAPEPAQAAAEARLLADLGVLS